MELGVPRFQTNPGGSQWSLGYSNGISPTKMGIIRQDFPILRPYFQVAKGIIIRMKFQVHMCHSAAFQQAIRREEASSVRRRFTPNLVCSEMENFYHKKWGEYNQPFDINGDIDIVGYSSSIWVSLSGNWRKP